MREECGKHYRQAEFPRPLCPLTNKTDVFSKQLILKIICYELITIESLITCPGLPVPALSGRFLDVKDHWFLMDCRLQQVVTCCSLLYYIQLNKSPGLVEPLASWQMVKNAVFTKSWFIPGLRLGP